MDFFKNHILIKYVIVALIISATIISCKEKISTASDVDTASLPNEEVKNMKVLYTENGELKNEFITEELQHFISTDTPYYYFPKGVYAASFTDTTGTPNASIISKKARYIQSPAFFEAYDSVVARNLKVNQRLETDTLFWEPSKKDKAIYSHSKSVIIRPPDTIPALQGFYTDSEFKYYTLIKAQNAPIYFKMEQDSTNTNNDTLNTVKSTEITVQTNER